QQRWGQTALMQAAREGHSLVVKYLLEEGANVKLRDRNGETALSIALDNDQKEIANQLKRAGALSDALQKNRARCLARMMKRRMTK
ncbi:MAG: ankyrin repeat domain-containing protein, partial [Balneolaceae bacterium]|nr:ankyrin repeat domain-containing protein [Balneolaceae bacterium]